MLLSAFIKEAAASLETSYPTAEARSIVLMLCSALLGTHSYTHIVEPQTEVPSGKESQLSEALGRLKAGEPIQYVIGRAEFCGLTFKVSPAVLIPRGETELLCREAIQTGCRIHRMRQAYGKKAEPVRVLDLCTGSGCIAWTIALSVPGAQVVAMDISEAALELASSQDFQALLKEKDARAPQFVRADLLAGPDEFRHGPFDIIVSNPPYIMESEKPAMRRNVLEYEPSTALFVPDDDPLLFHRAIVSWSTKLMAEDAVGISEINEALGPETLKLFRTGGFPQAEIMKDFYDRNRFVLYKKLS